MSGRPQSCGRLKPGVYYIDENGSPLFITEVDYHSFCLTILTTIISSLTKAYRSAVAAKSYVQACHKLQYADRSSKDIGELLSIRYGASETDPLRNFLVELSIRAFLGVSYRIPKKSLEEMDKSDHPRFVRFSEITASKTPERQRIRFVNRALRDIDNRYLSQFHQELNDTPDTEGQTVTGLRSTGTKLTTQAKITSKNPREPRPTRSPLIRSAVPDPSKSPVDQPSSKRARIETLSPSPSNSRDGEAQQNDQLHTTRSDGQRMQVDLGRMSTECQELESVSRSSNSPEHTDDSQPSNILPPAASTSQNMQSQHCASRASPQFNVPSSATLAEMVDQGNQKMAQDRTLMISDTIESNPSPDQSMPQLLSSLALTCTSEHDGAEGGIIFYEDRRQVIAQKALLLKALEEICVSASLVVTNKSLDILPLVELVFRLEGVLFTSKMEISGEVAKKITKNFKTQKFNVYFPRELSS